MKRTTLGFVFCILSGLFSVSRMVFAQSATPQIPSAIKYQAVLRDVNGAMLASREDVDMRITLRMGDPLNGIIVYQEDFNDISTDAYGLVHLNIGMGERVAGAADLLEVPWGEDPIYVQVEIQIDGNGYTNMGNSELLTVPYAFMAARAGTAGVDFGPLSDGALPKYNEAGQNFVNSGVRKTADGDTLEVRASLMKFSSDPDDPSVMGYILPMASGRKDQVLVLTNEMWGNYRVAKWADVEGAGGSGPGGEGWNGEPGDDERLLYWNEYERDIRSGALLYHYKTDSSLEVLYNLSVDSGLVVSGDASMGGNLEIGGNEVIDRNLYVGGWVSTDTLVASDTMFSVALRVVRLYADNLSAHSADIGLLRSHSIYNSGTIDSRFLASDTVMARDSLSSPAIGTDRLYTDNLAANSAYIDLLQSHNIYNSGTIDSRLVMAGDSLSSPAIGTERLYADDIQADSLSVRALNAHLPEAEVWIGNADGRNRPQAVSGVIGIDKDGVTALNIGFGKGLEYRLKTAYTPEAEKDSLLLNISISPGSSTEPKQGADSLWLRGGADEHILYAYNKGRDSVRVGIGTANAQARLHVAALGGDVLFNDTLRKPASKGLGATDTAVLFRWRGGDGAFQVGGCTSGYTGNPGRFSVSLGLNANSEGNFSTAIGMGSRSTAPRALALGYNTRATRSTAAAIGYGSEALADSTLAIGYKAKADGAYSTAIGPKVTVSSPKGISIGSTPLTSSAKRTLAFGYNNAIEGSDIIMIGNNNTQPGDSSIVLGRDNNVGSKNNIVIGNFNRDLAGDNGIYVGTSIWIDKDAEDGGTKHVGTVNSLPVGPVVLGTAASVSPNFISVGHKNINLDKGISVEDKSSSIVLMGRNLVNNIEYEGKDNVCNLFMLGDSYNSSEWKYETTSSGKDILPVFLYGASSNNKSGPLFGIDYYSEESTEEKFSTVFETDFYINGGLFYNGSLGTRSDVRSKKNIKISTYSLSLLDSVKSVSYSYKDDLKQQRHTGFIAQHVQKYFPHLVVADRMGMLNLKYSEFIPILWDFSAQLRHQNEKLQEQNKRLGNRVLELEGKVEKLEAEMSAIRSLLENKQ